MTVRFLFRNYIGPSRTLESSAMDLVEREAHEPLALVSLRHPGASAVGATRTAAGRPLAAPLSW
jgi:hypothetical protein